MPVQLLIPEWPCLSPAASELPLLTLGAADHSKTELCRGEAIQEAFLTSCGLVENWEKVPRVVTALEGLYSGGCAHQVQWYCRTAAECGLILQKAHVLAAFNPASQHIGKKNHVLAVLAFGPLKT